MLGFRCRLGSPNPSAGRPVATPGELRFRIGTGPCCVPHFGPFLLEFDELQTNLVHLDSYDAIQAP
jgi:hypothetical protein